MKKILKTHRLLTSTLSILVSVFLVAAFTYAATTISSNIVTGGTLSVSGASTLSTASTSGDFWLGNLIADDDDYLYFDASGSESISWDDDPGEFDISDDINIEGSASSSGNIYITTFMKMEPIATPSEVTGKCFIDSDDNQLNCYDGSEWRHAW